VIISPRSALSAAHCLSGEVLQVSEEDCTLIQGVNGLVNFFFQAL